jgi:hypothetical protein
MSKKTKREKILADARRIIKQNLNNKSVKVNPIESTIQTPKNNDSYKFQPLNPNINSKTISLNSEEFRFIKKDLIKTIVLSMFAVFIELLLYKFIKT